LATETHEQAGSGGTTAARVASHSLKPHMIDTSNLDCLDTTAQVVRALCLYGIAEFQSGHATTLHVCAAGNNKTQSQLKSLQPNQKETTESRFEPLQLNPAIWSLTSLKSRCLVAATLWSMAWAAADWRATFLERSIPRYKIESAFSCRVS
jgi:hypothetical protein